LRYILLQWNLILCIERILEEYQPIQDASHILNRYLKYFVYNIYIYKDK
jgi:hypothetical protein